MKQSSQLKFFLLFFFFPFLLIGQELTILWDSTYTDRNSKEVINEWLLLPDGNLVGVGYLKNGATKDGLLVKIETETGNLLFRKTYTDFPNELTLKSIAEAHDGTLYMVGEIGLGKKRSKGFILRTDELGNKLWKKKVGGGNTSFEKVVWQEDNRGLIAGYKNKKNDGQIWMLQVEKEKAFGEKLLGKGTFRDVTGLVANLDNTYWLTGNTKKSSKTNWGDIWVSKLDAEGALKATRIVGGKDFQQIYAAKGNYTGGLLIAGRTEAGTLGDGDGLIMELDKDGNTIIEAPFRDRQESHASSIVKTPNGNRWSILQTQPYSTNPNLFAHQLNVWSDKFLKKHKLRAEKIHSFQATQLIRTYQGNFIIAGEMMGTNESFRLLSVKNSEYLAAKSFNQLENSTPEFFFEDKNGDACFSANERGYLEFDLTNKGNAPVFEGSITLTAASTVAGLTFTRLKQFIPHLPAGKTRKIRIQVAAENNLQVGLSKGTIKVAIQGRELLNFPYEINSINCDKPTPITKTNIVNFGWIKPNIVSLNSREARTVEDFFNLEVSIATPNIIKPEDPKVYKNGVLLKDEKAGERQLSNPMKEGLGFNYRFNYTIRQLKEGKNTIFIQLDEHRTDSIIIYYEPHKPNLHVLAIGPSHKDLKYTAKDARDFALAIQKQAGNGFFERVVIDTLTTFQKTTATQIKVAFRKLKNRYEEVDRVDKIYPNDYLVVFVSSHGIKHDGKFRLLPSDFDEAAIPETTVDYKKDVIGYLNQIGCKKILFIDACLSGNVKGAKAPTYKNISSALLKANESASGTVSYASCSGSELSYEDAKWENGVFTEALLEALNGQKVQLTDGTYLGLEDGNTERDEIITIEELFQFLSIRVPDLMKTLNNGISQTPTIFNNQLEKKLPIFLLK